MDSRLYENSRYIFSFLLGSTFLEKLTLSGNLKYIILSHNYSATIYAKLRIAPRLILSLYSRSSNPVNNAGRDYKNIGLLKIANQLQLMLSSFPAYETNN